MFGEPAPAYRFIQPSIEPSGLFVAIGTSGRVIDVVMLAHDFDRSILVNPDREMYVTSFGSHDRYIDEYFEIFIQKKACEVADDLKRFITVFLVQ